MAPLCKLSIAADPALSKESNPGPVRENNDLESFLDDKPINDIEGLHSSNSSVYLQNKLSSESNCCHLWGNILTNVRQLQQNDAQKTVEIQWLQRRLDCLIKNISRYPYSNPHSWEPKEIETGIPFCMSPCAKSVYNDDTGMDTLAASTRLSSQGSDQDLQAADTNSLKVLTYPIDSSYLTNPSFPSPQTEVTEAYSEYTSNDDLKISEIQSLCSSYHNQSSAPSKPSTIATNSDSGPAPSETVETCIESCIIPNDLNWTSSPMQLWPIPMDLKSNVNNLEPPIIYLDRDPAITTTPVPNTYVDLINPAVSNQILGKYTPIEKAHHVVSPWIEHPIIDQNTTTKHNSSMNNKALPGDRVDLSKHTPPRNPSVTLQIQKYLEQEEKRQANQLQHEKASMAQIQLSKAKDEQREAWKLALKCKNKVPKLRAEKLKKENDEGWIYLLNWIEQVEMNSIGEQMRLYIVRLTVEKTVLRLLNLNSECSKWSDDISWSDIKKKLMYLIPKTDIYQATSKLMKIGMQEKDNVRVFAAKIKIKYVEVCELYNVELLPVSLNHVIACAVTANMNQTGRALYRDDIRENAEQITIEMEMSFRDISFRQSLFRQVDIKTRPGKQSMLSSYRNSRFNSNHHCYEKGYFRNVYSSFGRQRPNCWFFQRGYCKFKENCWYEHIKI